MKKEIVTIILSIFLCISAIAQIQRSDSTLVTFYPISFDSISLNSPHYLDTTILHANNFDPLSHKNTIYSTLSNIGLAHKSLRFSYINNVGFDTQLPAFSQYIQTENNLKTYLSLLPYSEIRYVMTSGNKEQHLNFRFGRQVAKGFFLSFEYNINYSPGTFINNKADNNYFWINALYTTKDHRYSALAYWFRNKLDMQENGGIKYDSVYTQHLETDNSVILTNLNNSTNYIKVAGAGFQHYLNLLPEPDDSTERKITLGRLTHSFAYQRNKMYFNETSANLPFYQNYDTLFNTKTTDTTTVYAIRNSLKWSSLDYKKYTNNVPLYLYAGIDYDFFRTKYYDYLELKQVLDRNYSQLALSGGVIINLFRSTTLNTQARIITLGYQIGDFNINGRWCQFLGRDDKNFGKLVFDFNMKRQSPTWFETSYYSNHFRWDNDFHAATYLSFDLHYHYRFFNVGVKQTSINDLIYFNTQARPTQYDGFCSVREAYGSVALKLWKFNIEGLVSLQKASNEDLVHVPLFLGKIKVGFDQPIFKNAAVLHPSIAVQYFTKYYADAYMPALRTFYLQNEVLIGNYPFFDAAIAINVKKANIYMQYSNMMLLLGNYNGFIAPHYPMRGSKFFFGINWRLFN